MKQNCSVIEQNSSQAFGKVFKQAYLKEEHLSFLQLSSSMAPKTFSKEVFLRPKGKEEKPLEKTQDTFQRDGDPKTLIGEKKPAARAPMLTTSSQHRTSLAQTNKTLREERAERKGEKPTENVRDKKNSSQNLYRHQWSKTETKKWWEARYHQKDREGGHQKDERESQHQKDEKTDKIQGIGKVSANSSSSSEATEKQRKKPILSPPKLGIFALYYILTKIGIFSDGQSTYAYKREIELVDLETTEAHKKRLEEIKQALKKEKETERWGIAVKAFSWITTLMGIVAGVVLIATGVGAVAGAMLIAGGVIQLTNQIMELSGGWQKIVALLPGEDLERKKAVVSWMQIAIGVLAIILCGAGVFWGGYSNFGEAMRVGMQVMGGIAAIGYGVTTIGEGASLYAFKNATADSKYYDKELARLKHMRQDLMDNLDMGTDRLEKLFEDLARVLEFEKELFQADQMALGRG
jgi:hypothetical protein